MSFDISEFVDLERERDRGESPVFDRPGWHADLLACTRCACRAEASRVVPGEGPKDATILLLGQNPGEDEDAQGRPFVGRGGEELAEWLRVLGLRRERVYITNAVRCHTTKNRPPKRSEIKVCADWTYRELDWLPDVQVLLPLGKPAKDVVLGDLVVPASQKLACYWVEVGFGDRRLLVAPLPHPAYLLRFSQKKGEMRVLLEHLKGVLQEHAAHAYQRAV